MILLLLSATVCVNVFAHSGQYLSHAHDHIDDTDGDGPHEDPAFHNENSDIHIHDDDDHGDGHTHSHFPEGNHEQHHMGPSPNRDVKELTNKLTIYSRAPLSSEQKEVILKDIHRLTKDVVDSLEDLREANLFPPGVRGMLLNQLDHLYSHIDLEHIKESVQGLVKQYRKNPTVVGLYVFGYLAFEAAEWGLMYAPLHFTDWHFLLKSFSALTGGSHLLGEMLYPFLLYTAHSNYDHLKFRSEALVKYGSKENYIKAMRAEFEKRAIHQELSPFVFDMSAYSLNEKFLVLPGKEPSWLNKFFHYSSQKKLTQKLYYPTLFESDIRKIAKKHSIYLAPSTYPYNVQMQIALNGIYLHSSAQNNKDKENRKKARAELFRLIQKAKENAVYFSEEGDESEPCIELLTQKKKR